MGSWLLDRALLESHTLGDWCGIIRAKICCSQIVNCQIFKKAANLWPFIVNLVQVARPSHLFFIDFVVEDLGDEDLGGGAVEAVAGGCGNLKPDLVIL